MNNLHTPKYPIGIVSKGRHESMITSRSLTRMKVHHYIVIEPQDLELYEEALINFKLSEYATLLVAPFSNHGDGPGRARNWFRDYCNNLGATASWILDDNIDSFYRLHKNKRIRVESGAIFRAAEDFVDRYENVPVAGFQYRFFVAPNSKYPPFVKNTRIYSCLLIQHNCKHWFQLRYNEDTDLSLRVLKAGQCTIQFNSFLQGKMATQTVKGGNTAEFYHVEGELDKSKWREGRMNAEGTTNKSQMLVDAHPDVCWMVWRYGRAHHHCNYEPFKKNKLKLKPEYSLKELAKQGNNEYGMKLITDWKKS